MNFLIRPEAADEGETRRQRHGRPMNEDGGRRTRGGREARARSRIGLAAPPFIERRIPPYEILGEEGLVALETHADRILAETGIEFRDDPEALALFTRRRGRGGTATAPLPRRPPTRDHPGERPRASSPSTPATRRTPCGSAAGTSSSRPPMARPSSWTSTGAAATARWRTSENFIKLAQSSPWLHHSGGTICEPVDVPVNKRHLDMVYAHIRLSDRAFMGSVTAESRAEDCIEMARIVFGRDFVDQNCVILGNVNVNSPLVWDGTMTKRSARLCPRQPGGASCVPFILGGAMGPVTNAGAIAQSLAETMAGCALTQLERPGAPVIFGNFLSSMSLRSGSPTFGTPEPAIGSMVIGQLARRLELPLRCSGNFTTSKLPDAQAMTEGTMSMLAAVHCGANFILHSAGFLDGLLSMSYEKFVLDTDLCGALHTYLDGRAGRRQPARRGRLRRGRAGQPLLRLQPHHGELPDAFWDFALSDNEAFEKWSEEGAARHRRARQPPLEDGAGGSRAAAAGPGRAPPTRSPISSRGARPTWRTPGTDPRASARRRLCGALGSW